MAHHCLVGCMRCQAPCPANKGLLELEPGKMSFSADETAAILSSEGTLAGPIGDEVMNKLKALAMEHCAPMLGRNLRALLKRRTRKHARPRRSPLSYDRASR